MALWQSKIGHSFKSYLWQQENNRCYNVLKKWAMSLIICLSSTIVLHGSEIVPEETIYEIPDAFKEREYELPITTALFKWFKETNGQASSLSKGTRVQASDTCYVVTQAIVDRGNKPYDCQKNNNSNCQHSNVQVFLKEENSKKHMYWSLQGSFSNTHCRVPYSNLSPESGFISKRPAYLSFLDKCSGCKLWSYMYKTPNEKGEFSSEQIDGLEYQHRRSRVVNVLSKQQKGYKAVTQWHTLSAIENKKICANVIESTPIVIYLAETTKMYDNSGLEASELAPVKKIFFDPFTHKGTTTIKKDMTVFKSFVTTVAALGVGCKLWSMYQQK